MYMIVDRGVLYGQLTNQSISFNHVYIRGQFTKIVIDSTNEVGFLYESVSKVYHTSEVSQISSGTTFYVTICFYIKIIVTLNTYALIPHDTCLNHSNVLLSFSTIIIYFDQFKYC